MLSSARPRWSDRVQAVMTGDLIAIFAYNTPAGGAVALPVTPIGAVDRDSGVITLTTSLAHHRKLRNLSRDVRVAVAYHTREHGFSTGEEFVLAHGEAAVDPTPAPERIAALQTLATRFLGVLPTGRFWDWALREEFYQRVIIDITLRRVAVWPAAGTTDPVPVFGEAWPAIPTDPQRPPANGTAPRVDVAKLHRTTRKLAHQVLAYRGPDGSPVVVPVRIIGQDEDGLQLDVTTGSVPSGGRRAGLTAHAFGPRVVGFAQTVCTGWLDVSGNTVTYSPHTASSLAVPPIRTLQLLAGGLVAKQVIRRARQNGSLGVDPPAAATSPRT